MKIGFIGAGRVGKAFGSYIQKHGLNISGYCDTTEVLAKEAASLTNSRSYAMENLTDLVLDSDILMLTVQDSAIAPLAEQLAELELAKGKTFCHTSGALGADELLPLRKHDGKLFSVHPLQAFATAETASEALGKSWIFVEGDFDKQEADRELEILLQAIPNPVRRLAKGKKAAYHAAAVVTSNYLMVLLKFGQELMVEAGVSQQDTAGLMPLIESALENFTHSSPEEALTGPIVRGDSVTVAKHLDVIRDMDSHIQKDSGSREELYKILGKATLELAKAKQLKNTEVIAELTTLLTGGSS